jgi:Arabinose efflux permease
MSRTDRHAGPREFITLCAFLMATIALAVDMMLPALDAIALDLSLHDPAQKPGIILSIFAGLVIGQLFFGPLSDAIGRYPSILIGMGIFLVGTVICALSGNYATLIMGRLIQGFGASAARIVTQAMIRDRFSGTEMARVMSFVMTIFIVIPVFAPMAGQVIFMVWRLASPVCQSRRFQWRDHTLVWYAPTREHPLPSTLFHTTTQRGRRICG